MNIRVCVSVLVTLAGVSLVGSAIGQPGPDIERERLAQTGMKFLSVGVDPREAAMGGASTAQRAGAAALFSNPAGIAQLDGVLDISLSKVEWIAGYQYAAGGLAFRPAAGRYGTFGVTVLSVDYGDFLATIRADNEKGFIDVGSVSPSAMAVGVGYGRMLTDRFSVGGQVKYVRQSLGAATMGFDDAGDRILQDNVADVTAFDFGVIYHTGFRSLNFAISARNFAQEVTYSEESFELPLTFRIGVSMDLMDLSAINASSSTHSFVVEVDAERPRDYNEMLRIGGEYAFMDVLFLRGGYVFPTDEQGLNAGGGIQLSVSDVRLRADYAYSEFGRLGNVHRVGLQLGL